MNSRKTSIVLADGHSLFRKSLLALLEKNTQFEIIGEAQDGKSLLEILKTRQPDVAIFNIELPVLSGRSVLEVIRRRYENTKTLIMCANQYSELVAELMAIGANGCIEHDTDVDLFYEAIVSIHKSGYYFDNKISQALLGNIIRSKTGRKDTIADFSPREERIIREIWRGKNNKEIASELHVSPSTVDTERGRIYTKANCNTAVALVKYALNRGIITLQD